MTWGAVATVAVGYVASENKAAASERSGRRQANASRSAAQLTADATNRATDLQAETAREAMAQQQAQFDTSQANFQPFQEAGVSALGQESALIGLSGPRAQANAFANFTSSPGQQFLRDRGEQALLRNEAAIGGLGGGRVREGLQQQGIGVAQQDLQSQLARLSAIRTGGQQAVGSVAGLGANMASNVGNINAGAANNISRLGVQGAQNVGQLGINASQSIAAGDLGAAAARNQQFKEASSILIGQL